MNGIDYVNNTIDVDIDALSVEYNTFMESCEKDTNFMFANFAMIEDKFMLESSIMGSVSDDLMMVYESEKKNIFARIGDVIIAIYKKLKEFIEHAIDAVKNITFKSKSDLQKLDLLLKRHPDLKDEAIVAFNKGALELADMRSLKELEASFDEILRLSRKKDMDPKSLRAKWEKAKEKFNKDQQSWSVVKVAAATATVIGAAVAVATLGPKLVEAHRNMTENLQKAKEAEADALKELKELKDVDGNSVIRPDMGGLEFRVQLHREMVGKRQAVVGNRLTVLQRLVNGVAKFVSKFDSDKAAAQRHQADLEAADAKREKRKSAERNEGYMKVAGETIARKEAELRFNKDHQKELRDNSYSDSLTRAKGSAAGKAAYDKEHPKHTT